MFTRIPFRTSKCVEVMYVDLMRGVVEVAYLNGSIYQYTCVSRRAILSLMCNPCMSLGLWVNHNLRAYDSKTALFGECVIVNHFDAYYYNQEVCV